MHTPSSNVLSFLHELYDGNRHTLVAKARDEQRIERWRAEREGNTEYIYTDERTVRMDFAQLTLHALANTTRGELLWVYASGMVEVDGTVESVFVHLLREEGPADPAQLGIDFGEEGARVSA